MMMRSRDAETPIHDDDEKPSRDAETPSRDDDEKPSRDAETPSRDDDDDDLLRQGEAYLAMMYFLNKTGRPIIDSCSWPHPRGGEDAVRDLEHPCYPGYRPQERSGRVQEDPDEQGGHRRRPGPARQAGQEAHRQGPHRSGLGQGSRIVN